jgi:hypothetical protein
VAFGNFKAGYVIAERADTSILRDPYTKKPYVYFYATQGLEALIQPTVEGAPINTPPTAPALGQQFLTGSSPTGAWVGNPGALATWTSGGWRFIAPKDGLCAIDRSTGLNWRYMTGQWRAGVVDASEVRIGGQKVLGSRRNAIASPNGGVTVDIEGRAAIDAVLNALRDHGLIAL